MPAGQRCFAVAAIAAAMVCVAAAGAQSVPCSSTAGMIGSGGVMLGNGGSKDSIPFSGTLKTSFEQKLPDGNAIHRVSRARQARDSSGRTMTEISQGCVRGEDGQMHERLNVNVNDPVARTSMNWQVGADGQPKVVHVFHQPEPVARQAPPVQTKRPEPTAEELERQQKARQASQAQQLEQRRENQTEDLGTRDFNGIPAQGTRSTRTIPAGEEGNDLPLVTINETWRSKELGLTLMMFNDDPRRGRTTTEYEELSRGEPDSALFAPPAGYTVQEQPQNGVIGGIVGGVVGGGLAGAVLQ